MASPSERSRNNVKAGIFVTVSLVLAVTAIISLTNIWQKFTRPTRQYTVTFDVADGVKNLKSGGKVRVGGVDMGTVVSVVPEVKPGEALHRIVVTFDLDRTVMLYDGATVLVTPALIGADAWLEITDVGNPETPMPPGGIEGFSGPGILTALVGSGNAKKADTMFDDAVEAVGNMRAATKNVRELAARVNNDDWPRWAEKINGIVDWGAQATDQLDRIMDEGEGFLSSAHAVITDNRPSIDRITANVETTSEDMQAIMHRIRTESMDRLNRMLDSGDKAAAQAEMVLEDLGEGLDSWIPQFGETIADARLAAQQIKLTSMELRRGPWKLLYRPTDDELQHELLYDSVRSFAFAAADMKASAASVERVLDKHAEDLGSDDRALIERLTRNLADSLTAYESAQQRLLDVLKQGD